MCVSLYEIIYNHADNMYIWVYMQWLGSLAAPLHRRQHLPGTIYMSS